MNQQNPGHVPSPVRQATAREFLAVVFRRKWIILGLFVITTVTVVAVSLTTPTFFQSSGRILVKRGERQSMLRPDKQIFSDWEQDLGSEMQIIKSVPVVRKAREILAAEAKQGKAPVSLDPSRVDVEVMGKSNVIAIAYTALDPIVAQSACSAVMDAYMDYRRTQMTSHAPQHFFDKEITDLQARIAARLEQRQLYTEQTGIAVPMAQTQSWLTQIAFLEQKRNDLASDLAASRSIEEAMKKMEDDPDIDLPTFDGAVTFTNEQALIALKTRVVEQQAKIAQLSETLRDDAPEMVGARQTLETLQGMLKKEVEARVRLAGSHAQSLQAKVDVADTDLADLRKKLSSAPSGLKMMDETDNDLSQLRFRLKELEENRDQALITANTSEDGRVVLLAPAGVAAATNSLDLVRLMLAPAFSVLVGIAIAFFIDGLDLTVRTANQAEEYLDLPVLASLSERRRRG
jgi:succinoglycan biosynthesis transport protein ExoP